MWSFHRSQCDFTEKMKTRSKSATKTKKPAPKVDETKNCRVQLTKMSAAFVKAKQMGKGVRFEEPTQKNKKKNQKQQSIEATSDLSDGENCAKSKRTSSPSESDRKSRSRHRHYRRRSSSLSDSSEYRSHRGYHRSNRSRSRHRYRSRSRSKREYPGYSYFRHYRPTSSSDSDFGRSRSRSRSHACRNSHFRSRKCRKHSSSSSPKTYRSALTAGKYNVCLFWNFIHTDFISLGFQMK